MTQTRTLLLLVLLVSAGCTTNSSPTSTQSQTLVQSIAGEWQATEIGISTPLAGGKATYDTLTFNATIAPSGDTAFTVSNTLVSGKKWHDLYPTRYLQLGKPGELSTTDSAFYWGTIKGRIHSLKLITLSGQFSGGGTTMNTTFHITYTRD